MHLRQVDCDLRSIAEIQKAILEPDRMLAAGIDTGFGDEWLRVGGMKMVADGSISERTAWLSRPYLGRPGDFGIQVITEQEL